MQKKKLVVYLIWKKENFNMFQNSTTKSKAMVVGDPAPKALQGSSGSPMPVLVLQGS